MYDDSGEMRIMKTESILKQKLQVEHSNRTVPHVYIVIIDRCALLWVIHWPTSGTVTDYANNFMGCISCHMEQSDVYLVFDQYYTPSIKGETRATRAERLLLINTNCMLVHHYPLRRSHLV